MLKLKAFFILGFLSLLFSFSHFAEAASRFRDLDAKNLHSDLSTIEFRFQLQKDISQDAHNHVLFLGVSSDQKESYQIEIIQDQLMARRYFGQCMRASFSYPYRFEVSEWHDIKLTWNEASTKFYVDDREVKPLGILSTSDMPFMVPGIRIGMEENFLISDFKASPESDISTAWSDKEFVRKAVCPNLKQLVEDGPQEIFNETTEFYHFPNQESRNIVKKYLALLPEDFAKSVKRVVYIEDARFSKGGEAGLADNSSTTIVLKGSYFSQPSVFFHEAAHIYDNKLGINFGVPDEKSEWAAISGPSSYYKGAKLEEYAKQFEKTKVQNAFLSAQGGQCTFEDLATWTGTAYEYYLKGKTLHDYLDPKGPKYCPKNKKKLDFLLEKGFLSQKVYNQLTKNNPG